MIDLGISFQIKVYIRGEKVVQMMRGSYDVSVAENGGSKNLTATDRYSSVFDHNGAELHVYKVGVMWLCLEVEQFYWRMCFDHGKYFAFKKTFCHLDDDWG